MTRLATPLTPVAVAFALGIALAPWTAPRAAWALFLTSLAAAVLALLAGHATHAAAPLLGAVIALGALRALPTPLPADHVAHLGLPAAARVEGRVAAEPIVWAPERSRVALDVERVNDLPRAGRLTLAIYGPPPALAEGQRVAIAARLERPTGFRNPGVFDAAARLARDGVHVVGSASSTAVVPLEPASPPWPARVRRLALGVFAERLPATSAGLLGGLVLGDRSGLPADVQDAFRRAGVYHVLAVSGFNVALLAGAVWAAARSAGGGRRAAAAAAIVAVLGFAAVVGAQPSVVRATVMASLVLSAVLLDREASVTNSLALAAVAILAARPDDLLDPGFQLSFAATAGIVAAPMPRGRLAAAIAVSLAAQAAVLPVTLAHFNQLSMIGVLANLAAVPLAGAATVLGLLGVLAAAAGDLAASAVFGAVWPLLLALRAVAAFCAAVPGAVVHLPAPSAAAIAVYAAALVAGLVAWHRRDRGVGRAAAGVAGLLLAAAVGLAALPVLSRGDGRLRVTVLDVGQGDAIVVEAPDGRAIVVDAGAGGAARLDAGERAVAPFLWNRGVLALHATLTTHADVDHAGGMPALRRLFGARETWDGSTGPRDVGGARFTPLVADVTDGRRNDLAVVLRIELGLAAILLASDVERAGERALLGARTPLAATVLKVGHHGAATSTTPEFLAAVRPSVAIVSVGARNAYGHPDAGVLARLAATGASVYRTDRDGAVLVETDGRALTITRWSDRRVERLCLDPETIC
ncbi:MAG TPA: ComEC/Rec2 family competence protein [Methylomirabilota bacterium]|nr:ComEC/Rec2 family competence protein [Methylomirabilota bacterium]